MPTSVPQPILLTSIPPESSLEPPKPTDGSRPWISHHLDGVWIHGRHFFPSFLGAKRERRRKRGWSKRSYNFKSRVFASTFGSWVPLLQLQIRFPTVSVKTHNTQLICFQFYLKVSQLRSYKFKLRTVPVNRSSINVFPQLPPSTSHEFNFSFDDANDTTGVSPRSSSQKAKSIFFNSVNSNKNHPKCFRWWVLRNVIFADD
jgi:hypothetical protein